MSFHVSFHVKFGNMRCCHFSINNPQTSSLNTWLLTWNITFWVKYSIKKLGDTFVFNVYRLHADECNMYWGIWSLKTKMGKRLKTLSYSANTFLIWTQQTLYLIALILYRLDLIAEVCARNCLYQNNESFMVHSESCYSDLAAFGGVLASIRTKGEGIVEI